jgi:hypothetical protein
MPSLPTSFSDAQLRYEAIEGFNITTATEDLKSKLTQYITSNSVINSSQLETAFTTISNYYNEMAVINDFLQSYVNRQTVNLSNGASLSEERYDNKVHPEEAVLSRESTRGLLPELRVRSLPYLLAMSVFMASLSIFLIFQIFGFSGQVNLPQSITGFFSSPASATPFYSNPLFLGGVIILLLVALVIFAVLYFKSKKMQINSKE